MDQLEFAIFKKNIKFFATACRHQNPLAKCSVELNLDAAAQCLITIEKGIYILFTLMFAKLRG